MNPLDDFGVARAAAASKVPSLFGSPGHDRPSRFWSDPDYEEMSACLPSGRA